MRGFVFVLTALASIFCSAQDLNIESGVDSLGDGDDLVADSLGDGDDLMVDSIGIHRDFIEEIEYQEFVGNSQRESLRPKYVYTERLSIYKPGGLEISPFLDTRFSFTPAESIFSCYVSQQSLPGLMGVESGKLAYAINMGKLRLTPSVFATKYGYFGGLTTSVGFGGELEYAINDNFSLTLFGGYQSNSWAANPAVMANMGSSRFGGYGTWNINEHWSLSVGAQRVYDASTRGWSMVPIVMPTYWINESTPISVDLGGILHEVIDMKRDKWFGGGNPTMGPPVHNEIIIPPRD